MLAAISGKSDFIGGALCPSCLIGTSWVLGKARAHHYFCPVPLDYMLASISVEFFFVSGKHRPCLV